MNILLLIPFLLYLNSARGFWQFGSSMFAREPVPVEEVIERESFNHVFGIEPFLYMHRHNPLALYNMFYDDELDNYEDVIHPKHLNGSIVKVRKALLKPHPVVQQLLLQRLYDKNIPELTNYLDKLFGKRK